MSSPNLGESSDVTDESVIRGVLPQHGPKRLARLVGVPIETARSWYYRHLSAARRRQVALALLAEMDAQDMRRIELRRRLGEMVGGGGEYHKVDSGGDRESVVEPAAENARSQADEMG